MEEVERIFEEVKLYELNFNNFIVFDLYIEFIN